MNRYEITANAVRNAEKALETLKEFSNIQYKAKGETMKEQILDYVLNTLSDANYICKDFKYKNISLRKIETENSFVFYIHDNRGLINAGYPIFSIKSNGEFKYIRDLEEWMMLILVKEWNGFKKELDERIKYSLKEHTERINKELMHIGYVNEQLAKWKV